MADDPIERLLGVFVRVSRTKGVATGVSGMTIEAQSQATMYRISAWDMEVLPDAADEISRLRAGIRAEIDWHENEAKRLREIAGHHGAEGFILVAKARAHESAAARLRALLPQPTPETEGK